VEIRTDIGHGLGGAVFSAGGGRSTLNILVEVIRRPGLHPAHAYDWHRVRAVVGPVALGSQADYRRVCVLFAEDNAMQWEALGSLSRSH